MITMIMKMSGVTLLYVLLTILLWKWVSKKRLSLPIKLFIGLVYGGCSILSTHYGVNYSHMMINVRDLGPLAAGLFFDPLSGILAGLIGGIERYIAGTYWGIGSYTRIACSVSTCLAGFASAALNIWLFRRKKPSVAYGFIMGAVMEVFHMYVVFITHRGDMNMALYVVQTCAGPMIIFTGIGLALCSVSLLVISKEWKNPFRRRSGDKKTVSERFQFWQFIVTATVLIFNLLFSFSIQKQTAVQKARNTLQNSVEDIRKTYDSTVSTLRRLKKYPEQAALTSAKVIAAVFSSSGGTDEAVIERLRLIYQLSAVDVAGADGTFSIKSGTFPEGTEFTDLSGINESGVSSTSEDGIVTAAVRFKDRIFMVSADPTVFTGAIDISGITDVMSYFHVGSKGTFDILSGRDSLFMGSHSRAELSSRDSQLLEKAEVGKFFNAELFGVKSLCLLEQLDDERVLLVQLPYSEIYADSDAQLYELAFGDILLFAVIYVLIALLVQQIVVKNLSMVNKSLSKITGGDLNEIVNVHGSSEFASLSNDINMTVDTLKGYIDAAEKRIEQELEFARTIQESALPRNFDFPRSDFEVFASMDPAKEVGGDFYDFFFVDQNKLALVIADVSGKGIPASLFMMRAKTAVRGLAESGKTPGEILRAANSTLCEGNDADMFVTVWLGILDLTTGVMTCANAGHEYPVIIRSGGEAEVFKDRHGLALAAMDGMKYKEYELTLSPGDRLFVYTDGIPEAINENTEQYGLDRLLAALDKVRGEALSAVLPAVRADISDFVGKADQFDDITMLSVTYIGSIEENS